MTGVDGDKVCPLCAEEMDLTDQQLKPCKCGYEICVWCWHHIMEMAEKEETDGRCPACRTPYDKERIVGMAANCERLVAGNNAARRNKFQKAKPKSSSETRKQLSTVRVLQKNLVYIIGLPASICDESSLEGREYFGQYGNVLKVSISRPSSTTIQHASNNSSFSVYVNYAMEEEAVRCIQAVNNYILDGKPLRAFFGTNKYCHAWLRNMNCSNPHCLYLHEIGNQEDSFTKDETISAYSRRVPNIPSNSFQRHAGNVLPPPADEWTSTGSTTTKHISNNLIGQAEVSNGGVGRPTVLPVSASWGSRPSNGLLYSEISIKQNVESNNTSAASSSVNTGIEQVSSAWHDDLHTSEAEENPIFIINGISNLSEFQLPEAGVLSKHHSTMAAISFRAGACDPRDSAWDDAPVTASNFPKVSYDSQAIGRSKMMLSQRFSAVDTKKQAAGIGLSSDSTVETDQPTNLCPSSPAALVLEEDGAGVSSATWKTMNAENRTAKENFDNRSVASGTSGFTCNYENVNQDAQNVCSILSFADIDKNSEQQRTFLLSSSRGGLLKNPASNSRLLGECLGKSFPTPSHIVHISTNAQASRKPSGWKTELEHQTCQSTGNRMGDLSLSVSDIRQRLSAVTNQRSCSPQRDHSFSESNGQSSCTINSRTLTALSSPCEETLPSSEVRGLQSFRQNVDKLADEQYEAKLSNIYKPASTLDSNLISSNEGLVHLNRFSDIGRADKCSSVPTSESHIISDILSLDFDPWDDSLSIANKFSDLLGEKDGREDSVVFSRPLSTQKSSQSRFSFARQENQESFIESSISAIDQAVEVSSVKASYVDASQDDFAGDASLGNVSTKNRAFLTPDRPAGMSRAKVSAPPGFSLPNRAPPPGFAVQDCRGQNFKTAPDIDLIYNSLVGNHRLVHPTENLGDVEFNDPAILAVGKDLMPVGSGNATFPLGSAFPALLNSSEYDPRHQLLMQPRVSSHKSMRFPDHSRDNFLPVSDSYIASRCFAQNQSSLSPLAQLSLQQSQSSPISSCHWDSSSNMQTTTSLSLTDFLRNRRLGSNNYYLGKGEEEFHVPSSDDIHCREFGS